MKRAQYHQKSWGNFAESLAVYYLRLKFYRILARQFHLHHAGEIDIIAQKGGVIVFVEVKARKTIDDALYAVTVQKSIRIQKAAGFFMAKNPNYALYGQRYDMIAIAPWKWPVHLKDAFRPLQ